MYGVHKTGYRATTIPEALTCNTVSRTRMSLVDELTSRDHVDMKSMKTNKSE